MHSLVVAGILLPAAAAAITSFALQLADLGSSAGALVPAVILFACDAAWTTYLIWAVLRWNERGSGSDTLPILFIAAAFALQVFGPGALYTWVDGRYPGSYAREDPSSITWLDPYLLSLDCALLAGFSVLLPVSLGARILFGIHLSFTWFSFTVLAPCFVAILVRTGRSDRGARNVYRRL
jgi:hypothetical protein